MADIVVVAAKVARLSPGTDEVYDFIAAATITAGQALYVDSNGRVNLADANGSGTLQFCGIALAGSRLGQAVSVLKRGYIGGFTISGLNYWAQLFVSNTAGALADAAGGTSILGGRIVPLTDGNTRTKALYIEADWLRNWA